MRAKWGFEAEDWEGPALRGLRRRSQRPASPKEIRAADNLLAACLAKRDRDATPPDGKGE